MYGKMFFFITSVFVSNSHDMFLRENRWFGAEAIVEESVPEGGLESGYTPLQLHCSLLPPATTCAARRQIGKYYASHGSNDNHVYNIERNI